jgi:MFS family permease
MQLCSAFFAALALSLILTPFIWPIGSPCCTVLQGIGAGGILSLTEIIVSDIVPLRERGKYVGIIAAVWALASLLGPVVGGALATAGQWRWLFCRLHFLLQIKTPTVDAPPLPSQT